MQSAPVSLPIQVKRDSFQFPTLKKNPEANQQPQQQPYQSQSQKDQPYNTQQQNPRSISTQSDHQMLENKHQKDQQPPYRPPNQLEQQQPKAGQKQPHTLIKTSQSPIPLQIDPIQHLNSQQQLQHPSRMPSQQQQYPINPKQPPQLIQDHRSQDSQIYDTATKSTTLQSVQSHNSTQPQLQQQQYGAKNINDIKQTYNQSANPPPQNSNPYYYLRQAAPVTDEEPIQPCHRIHQFSQIKNINLIDPTHNKQNKVIEDTHSNTEHRQLLQQGVKSNNLAKGNQANVPIEDGDENEDNIENEEENESDATDSEEESNSKETPSEESIREYPFLLLNDVIHMERHIKRSKRVLIDLCQTRYDVIRDVCEGDFHWQIQTQSNQRTDYNIQWIDTYLHEDDFRRMQPFQKVNHLPGSQQLGKKNLLGQNLQRMRQMFPSNYNFYPHTWVLPLQFEDLRKHHQHQLAHPLNQTKQSQPYYIVKPEASCQGKGIFLTNQIDQLQEHEHYVVQEYIKNPLLIDGLKFDLRLYVLIKSISPLKIFLYQEGLARFATVPYVNPNKSNAANLMMHLTNYALNKKSPDFIQNEDSEDDDVGHKRSFSSILKHLYDDGRDVEKLLMEIRQIIVKTVISAQPHMSHIYKTCQPKAEQNEMCFEVLGFDIMIDDQLKPYLIEVNHTPSFWTDSPLDFQVKRNLILDTLRLVNITPDAKKRHFASRIQQQIASRSLHRKKYGASYAEEVDIDAIEQDVFDWEEAYMGAYLRIFPADDDSTNYSQFIHSAARHQSDLHLKRPRRSGFYPDSLSEINSYQTGQIPSVPAGPIIVNQSQMHLDFQEINLKLTHDNYLLSPSTHIPVPFQQLTYNSYSISSKNPSKQSTLTSCLKEDSVDENFYSTRKTQENNNNNNNNNNQMNMRYPQATNYFEEREHRMQIASAEPTKPQMFRSNIPTVPSANGQQLLCESPEKILWNARTVENKLPNTQQMRASNGAKLSSLEDQQQSRYNNTIAGFPKQNYQLQPQQQQQQNYHNPLNNNLNNVFIDQFERKTHQTQEQEEQSLLSLAVNFAKLPSQRVRSQLAKNAYQQSSIKHPNINDQMNNNQSNFTNNSSNISAFSLNNNINYNSQATVIGAGNEFQRQLQSVNVSQLLQSHYAEPKPPAQRQNNLTKLYNQQHHLQPQQQQSQQPTGERDFLQQRSTSVYSESQTTSLQQQLHHQSQQQYIQQHNRAREDSNSQAVSRRRIGVSVPSRKSESNPPPPSDTMVQLSLLQNANPINLKQQQQQPQQPIQSSKPPSDPNINSRISRVKSIQQPQQMQPQQQQSTQQSQSGNRNRQETNQSLYNSINNKNIQMNSVVLPVLSNPLNPTPIRRGPIDADQQNSLQEVEQKHMRSRVKYE